MGDDTPERPGSRTVRKTTLPDGQRLELHRTEAGTWAVRLARVTERGRDRHGRYNLVETDTLSAHDTREAAEGEFNRHVREAVGA